MFEENEDVILPDDFEASPQVEESAETPEIESEFDFESESDEPTADTTPVEETEEQPESDPETQPEKPQTIKVKYNKEEQEIPLDEAQALVQKGMNYDKALERTRQEARDSVIAEQGYVWNGKPITTEAEYKQALQEQELLQKYQDKNLPEEVIQELMEVRKFREQSQEEKKAEAEKQKVDADFNEFFQFFKQANDRDFNPQKDKIPNEVWEQVAKGTPLKFAYMEHNMNELRSQVKTLKQNEENKKKAPVQAVSTHGSQEVASTDPFLLGFDSI